MYLLCRMTVCLFCFYFQTIINKTLIYYLSVTFKRNPWFQSRLKYSLQSLRRYVTRIAVAQTTNYLFPKQRKEAHLYGKEKKPPRHSISPEVRHWNQRFSLSDKSLARPRLMLAGGPVLHWFTRASFARTGLWGVLHRSLIFTFLLLPLGLV